MSQESSIGDFFFLPAVVPWLCGELTKDQPLNNCYTSIALFGSSREFDLAENGLNNERQ